MDFNPEASAYDDEIRNKDTAIVRFEIDSVELTAQSEATGSPVFEEREFAIIRHPGDRTYEQREIVREDHKRRWPAAYAAFKAGNEAPLHGTPITEWPPINKAQVRTLQYLEIRTVESLAALTDDVVQKIGTGGMTLRSKAQTWLAERTKGAASMAAVAERDKLRAELDAVKEQLATLSAAQVKKPGKQAEAAA